MVPVVAFMKVSSQCCCLDGVSGSAFMFAGFGGGQVFGRKVGRGAPRHPGVAGCSFHRLLA